ncbi:hypothetical protein SAMN04515695_5398 [Pseudovibrio sp. Tun.PSC04-5.I4]|nr:hypothetical protein SAMN04515695_5398 [Pseudovibrio sp. Tun.PSC04-5.I4]
MNSGLSGFQNVICADTQTLSLVALRMPTGQRAGSGILDSWYKWI